MQEMLIAAFARQEEANDAINDLTNVGYPLREISIMTRHGQHESDELSGEISPSPPVSTSVATGATFGGITGLVLGTTGVIILGPIAALLGLGGVLGTTITGAIVGAAAGGLAGALTNLGVPEETAQHYSETIDSGGVILVVPILDQANLDRETIRHILEDNGAEGTSEVEAERPIRQRAHDRG